MLARGAARRSGVHSRVRFCLRFVGSLLRASGFRGLLFRIGTVPRMWNGRADAGQPTHWVVFRYNPSRGEEEDLEQWHRSFVAAAGLKDSQCLVFAHVGQEGDRSATKRLRECPVACGEVLGPRTLTVASIRGP